MLMEPDRMTLRIAALQMVSSNILDENLNEFNRLAKLAVADGAKMVALPEYFCFMGLKDTDKLALAEEPGKGPIQDYLANVASRLGIWIFAGSIPLKSVDPQKVLNTQLVFNDLGQQVSRYDKIHLFSFSRGNESYDESRSILAGRQVEVVDTPFARIGLSICYDLRFPELYRKMGTVDLILVPSAFTYTTGQAHWEVLLRARAIENQCYVLAPAQGGRHANGRRTWGHSMLIDPWGEVMTVLAENPGVVIGDIDPLRIKEVRESLPALTHRVI